MCTAQSRECVCVLYSLERHMKMFLLLTALAEYFVMLQQSKVNPLLRFHSSNERFYITDCYMNVNRKKKTLLCFQGNYCTKTPQCYVIVLCPPLRGFTLSFLRPTREITGHYLKSCRIESFTFPHSLRVLRHYRSN